LGSIKLVPVAEESLGVRAMCFYVETPDLRLLLDAGLSLAPRRFGLPPHPLEFRAARELRARIAEFAGRSSVVFVSHYHYDHWTPAFRSWYEWSSEEAHREVYEGKLVLAKDPKNNINPSQLRRGHAFLRSVEGVAREVRVADSAVLTIGNTRVEVSEPVPHGPEGTRLGYVLMVRISYEDEVLVFAPDVQGPMCEASLLRILNYSPQVLVIGGPPLYLSGSKVPEESVSAGVSALKLLALSVPELIICHHTLRSADWRERLEPVFSAAESAGHRVMSAAEYAGLEERLLEARRPELHRERPPSEEFLEWLRLPREERASTEPPLD